MKRRIYFVRHGLTLCNEQGTIQDEKDPLSPRGIEQATTLAHRLGKVPFDTLIASDMVRAQATAEIVAGVTGHEPLYSPLFREVMYPSVLWGKHRGDPEVQAYYQEESLNRDDLEWRYGDRETTAELYARIDKALQYVTSIEGTSVVVTHGHFLRKLVLRLLSGGILTPGQEYVILPGMLTTNTAITAFELRNDRWYLLTWNDHAHLG